MPSRGRKILACFCVFGWQSTGDTDADHAGHNLVDFQQQSSNQHQLPINHQSQRFPMSQMTKPAREQRLVELTHWPSERRHQRPEIRGEAESKISWVGAGLALVWRSAGRRSAADNRWRHARPRNATVRRHPDPAPKCLLACYGKPGGRGEAHFSS